jgi:general secretion pathway protein G
MQARNGITMAASWMTRLQAFIRRCPLGEAFKATGRSAARDSEAGFTLLEILVVIVILGLLIGLVAPAVLRQLGGARISIAHQSIARIGSVLDMYKLDVGTYPSTDQGLEALVQAPAGVSNWNGPYVQSGQLPVDPWNHAYVYRDPSNRAGHDYDLCSAGPSGNATGDDMICN